MSTLTTSVKLLFSDPLFPLPDSSIPSICLGLDIMYLSILFSHLLIVQFLQVYQFWSPLMFVNSEFPCLTCRGGPMAVHAAAPERLPSGVQCCLRRLHPCSRGLLWVLQPASSMGALHHGQHHGSAPGLQEDHQSEWQHLTALHQLPGRVLVDLQLNFFYSRDWMTKTHTLKQCGLSLQLFSKTT